MGVWRGSENRWGRRIGWRSKRRRRRARKRRGGEVYDEVEKRERGTGDEGRRRRGRKRRGT